MKFYILTSVFFLLVTAARDTVRIFSVDHNKREIDHLPNIDSFGHITTSTREIFPKNVITLMILVS